MISGFSNTPVPIVLSFVRQFFLSFIHFMMQIKIERNANSALVWNWCEYCNDDASINMESLC